MPVDPLRYALVAYGSAARTIHLPLLAFESRLQLHGIFARKAEAREQIDREQRCKAYATLDELCADADVDLAIITTPHDSHAAIAVALLDAGKHVVTDKPMCLTTGEFDAMWAAQQRSGKLLTVFHNARLSGDFLTLRAIADSGALGDLRWLEISMNRHGLSKRSAWRNDANAAGGRLIDLGVHLIDQALQVFVEPATSVYTRMNRDWPGTSVESACQVTIGFASGRTAVLDVGSMTRIPKPKYLAVGTAGTWSKPPALSDPQDAALASGNWDDYAEDPLAAGTLADAHGTRPTPTIAGDWRRFYANVVDAIRGDAAPSVTLDQMRRVISVLQAAVESSRSGRVVVPD